LWLAISKRLGLRSPLKDKVCFASLKSKVGSRFVERLTPRSNQFEARKQSRFPLAKVITARECPAYKRAAAARIENWRFAVSGCRLRLR